MIKNPKYKPNKKNGGHVPPVNDQRILYIPIGCQKCIECRKQKARAWQTRLQEEIKESKNGTFITLTFNNESIIKINQLIPENITGYDRDNAIATKGIRLFLERYRKKYKKSVRHWLVTELGHKGTENIHLHGILWTDNIKQIDNIWQYGFTWKGHYVNNRTINYIIKYITKIDKDHKYYQSIILTSPGIGNQYTKTPQAKYNKYKKENTQEYYRTETGHKINMPIYWRNKIYTEEEREKLWIEKLDKQERYVLGKKIDISKNEEQYMAALKTAQKKNERLGYGNDKINWDEVTYENQRREILRQTRMKRP